MSEWEKFYIWNTNKNKFVETSNSGSQGWTEEFFLHRLSPIDGIYYKSGEKRAFALEKKNTTNIITFGSGLFICNIQTRLEKYEFHTKDLILTPKGRGIFLVDTTHSEVKIFSFDSFIETELVTGIKQSPVAYFTLFPSLFFTHDTENTLKLKNADILRISIVDSIRYVNLKTANDRKMLFAWETLKQDEDFFLHVQEDISARIQAFANLYSTLLKPNTKDISIPPLLSTSNTFLINDSKKEVLLKNSLIENIWQLFQNTKKSKEALLISQIDMTIADMKALSPHVYLDGLTLLRRYYNIALFSHFVKKDNIFDFSSQESPLIALTERIIPKNVQLKQNEYYTHLWDIFSVYYFLALTQDELNRYFKENLKKIIENKVLPKTEFLSFTFFVTQYLSTGPVIPNEDAMNIISYLFQITNDYYLYNKSDEKKIAPVTSIIFYNYNKIFTKIHTLFLSTFFNQTIDGLLLKDEYVLWGEVKLEQNFIDSFKSVILNAKADVESKKNTLSTKNLFQSDPLIIDNYNLLKTRLESFDIFISMFDNYPKYLNDFNLNEASKKAQGILMEKGNEMSKEQAQSYLKDFNNLDLSSLQVTNNFKQDGFYQIQVIIWGNTFRFKLWEQDHSIADISYKDTLGENHIFPNSSISLDKKKEQLKELFSWADDSATRYKYDFKNFFEITFIKGNSITDSTTTEVVIDSTPPEIQLFIQRELLDKDFKNIVSFLPIGFKNIHVSIREWNYIIELTDIEKSFAGESNNYLVELSSKYIFNKHNFSRVEVKVEKERDIWWYEFDETSIQILPARIWLLSLPESLKDLGFYIDTIKSAYTHQKDIIIDLTGKRVLLDTIPFIPKFPTE